ncbi:MAG: hypothetical protein QOD77_432 [Thermoplasmata archaeon]|nr:hypothetical protein [Thermoplasmata archaeon]
MKVLALLLVLAVPLAAATDTAVLTFESVPVAKLVVDDARSEAESTFLRRSADALGDRDGMVSQEEADQAATIARPTVEREMDKQVRGGNLTLDGQLPATAALKVFTLSNMTGPVERPDPVVAHAEVSILFGVNAGANHTLFSRVRPATGQYNTTIWLPPGYETVDGARSLQFNVTGESEGATIPFRLPPVVSHDDEGHAAPAGGLGLGLWAVALALAGRRLTAPAPASAAATRRRDG